MTRRTFPSADFLLAAAAWSAATVIAAVFLVILGDIAAKGLPHINWDFLTTAPRNAGREGGISTIIVSTTLILFIALASSVPLGLASAIWLASGSERGAGRRLLVTRSLDVLAGVPSVVIALFGNAFFSKFLGLGFSILSDNLTLACMILPILIRTTAEGLRAVPTAYRLGTAALGYSQFGSLWHVLLPMAAPSILAGLLLSIGRAAAETAALIFTSGYVDRMPESIMDSGRALSVHIFDLSMNVPGGDRQAYATSAFLILALLGINVAVAALTRLSLGNRVSE